MLKSVEAILNATVRATGYDLPTLLSDSKQNSRFEARAAAIYLARTTTRTSYPELARMLGRHHTTVLHSFVVFSERVEQRDSRSLELLRAIKRELRATR